MKGFVIQERKKEAIKVVPLRKNGNKRKHETIPLMFEEYSAMFVFFSSPEPKAPGELIV